MDPKKEMKRPEWTKDKKEFDFITGRTFKHSRVLAYASWFTVFGIIWLTLFNIIPLTGPVWGFWGFSLFVGVVSAAYAK